MAPSLSLERAAYLRRMGREKRLILLAQILLLVGFFLLWEVAARLGISAFEPVIFITSTGRTAAGQPVEYAESYYPAGSSSFLIEVHR